MGPVRISGWHAAFGPWDHQGCAALPPRHPTSTFDPGAPTRRIALLSRLALSLLPTLAFAQGGATLKLSWDHCAGSGYVGDRSFACNTNTGADTLYGSVVFEDGLLREQAQIFEAHVTVTTLGSSLPSWWQTNTGSCRSAAVTGFVPSVDSGAGCEPAFGFAPLVSVLGVKLYADGGASTVEYTFIAGVPDGSGWETFYPGLEYRLFGLRLSHAKSTGTGSCAGCSVPACLGFGGLKLLYTSGHVPANESFTGNAGSTVTWQGAYVSSFTPIAPHCDANGCTYLWSGNLACASGPVPARNHTWGAIKSMYH